MDSEDGPEIAYLRYAFQPFLLSVYDLENNFFRVAVHFLQLAAFSAFEFLLSQTDN